MAVEQINSAGGILLRRHVCQRDAPWSWCPATSRRTSCAPRLTLVNDLHVPAIVGPNTSQDTLDVSTKVDSCPAAQWS